MKFIHYEEIRQLLKFATDAADAADTAMIEDSHEVAEVCSCNAQEYLQSAVRLMRKSREEAK